LLADLKHLAVIDGKIGILVNEYDPSGCPGVSGGAIAGWQGRVGVGRLAYDYPLRPSDCFAPRKGKIGK
jgi:hypothetical protein